MTLVENNYFKQVRGPSAAARQARVSSAAASYLLGGWGGVYKRIIPTKLLSALL